MYKFKTREEAEARMASIGKELELLENIEKKSDYEDKRIDFLVDEFKEIRKTIDTPVNMGGLKQDTGSGGDFEEARCYNKDSLPELRSYIKSKDPLGMGNENLSPGKLIRGLATGDWSKAAAEYRTLGTSTEGGGYLISEAISSQVITMALAKSQVINAGALVFPMETKTVILPRIIKMPETQWKAENAMFTGSKDMNFDGVTLEAKTLMALISLSVELAQDGMAGTVETAINNAISLAIAQEIDRACLIGAGTLEPKGIVNTTDVLTEIYSAAGYSCFSSGYFKVEAENGTVNALIAPSSVYAALDQLQDLQNQPLNAPVSWSKYKQLSSNQLLNNQSVMGDFTGLLIGTRQTINLEVSREAIEAFERLQILIRAYVRIDVAVKQPKHFCVIGETSS